MAMQPTVREMQMAILTIRKFANEDDYNLCREYQRSTYVACADLMDAMLTGRDLIPVELDADGRVIGEE